MNCYLFTIGRRDRYYDDDRLPMMKFTLSKHAEDTMREREIDLAWLAATMDTAEITEQHPDDPTLSYAFCRILDSVTGF